jgi:hypothetical protein
MLAPGRLLIGVNQERLAKALGLTFQQEFRSRPSLSLAAHRSRSRSGGGYSFHAGRRKKHHSARMARARGFGGLAGSREMDPRLDRDQVGFERS